MSAAAEQSVNLARRILWQSVAGSRDTRLQLLSHAILVKRIWRQLQTAGGHAARLLLDWAKK